MPLKQRAITGAKWTSISTIVTAILNFLQLIILARILGPETYGLMGMVLIVIGFAQAYADFGISNAIIYRQDTTRDQLSSLYWLNVLAGILLFTIIVALSPFITILFHEPRLLNLLLLTAATFLIIPFGQQFQILLQKNLEFEKLAFVSILSASGSTIVAILLALNGYGVYALVWGSLTAASIQTLILLIIGINRWKPQLHLKRKDLDNYLNFGLYQMGERSINYFMANVDKIIVGAFLSAESLGFYNLAYNLIVYPFITINPIITKITFPVFAKLQEDLNLLKNSYLKVLKLLSIINFPIYFGIACTAYLIIPIFFGPQWTTSILLVEILAGVGLLKSTANPVGSLLLAKGHARLGFFWNLFLMCTQIPGIILGAYFGGVVGVAMAYLLLIIGYLGLSYMLLIRNVLGPCFSDYLKSMIPAFFMSIAMSVGVLGVGMFLKEIPLLWQLISLVLVGIIIYMGLFVYFEKPLIKELVPMIFSKKGLD